MPIIEAYSHVHVKASHVWEKAREYIPKGSNMIGDIAFRFYLIPLESKGKISGKKHIFRTFSNPLRKKDQTG